MVCLSSGFLLAFIFRLYLIWVNRTRDRECADAADSTDIDAPGLEVAMAMEDMTDMQIRKFLYVYWVQLAESSVRRGSEVLSHLYRPF